MRRRSVVRMAVLRHVFNSNRERMLDAHIARLAVLYEDLRVETSAIKAHSIPCLDVLDPEHEYRESPARIGSYRSHYFLRRSISTLSEFAEGLRLLTECEEFVLIKQSWNEAAERTWSDGVQFFTARERAIKEIRNDVGGHFGLTAARFAIQNLTPSTMGRVEVITEDGGCLGPLLHFAGEIAASSIFRHIPGNNREDEFNKLIDWVLVGYRHAIECVQTLVAIYLWPRLGRG
jgi:hypothetical protein